MVKIIYHGTYNFKEVLFECEKCGCRFTVNPSDKELIWIDLGARQYPCPECRWLCEELK